MNKWVFFWYWLTLVTLDWLTLVTLDEVLLHGLLLFENSKQKVPGSTLDDRISREIRFAIDGERYSAMLLYLTKRRLQRIRINVKFLLQNSRQQEFRRDDGNSVVHGRSALADVFITRHYNQTVFKLLRQRRDTLNTVIQRWISFR